MSGNGKIYHIARPLICSGQCVLGNDRIEWHNTYTPNYCYRSYRLRYQQVVIAALLHSKFLGFPRILFPVLRILVAPFVCESALAQNVSLVSQSIMVTSVAGRWPDCKWTQKSESRFFLCKKYELGTSPSWNGPFCAEVTQIAPKMQHFPNDIITGYRHPRWNTALLTFCCYCTV